MTNYSTSASDQYLETEILSAGPVRRVQLLYQGAIKAIGKARVALAARDIPTRAFQVNRAHDILSELAMSIDHSCDKPLTRELVELYDFAQRCLIEGSSKQVDKPFADAEQVLKTVLEAWKDIPELEAPSAGPAPSSYVPADDSSGDSFSIGGVGSGLNQLG